MPRHPFSVLLERKFLEWQIEIGERKSQAEFAKLIGVSRASLTMWMNGDHLPERDNVHKVAKVLGNEVYDVLNLPRPNPYLQQINQIFERLSPEHQKRLAEMAERYKVDNETDLQRVSKQRKTSSHS
jgi:transcriptional regulator with XRE-family HTH domain